MTWMETAFVWLILAILSLALLYAVGVAGVIVGDWLKRLGERR